MGLIISRFRRKKSTGETLAALDSKIQSIEQYGRSTEQRRRKVIGHLVITSVGLYILGLIVSFFYYRPHGWKDGIVFSIPILVSPMLIFLLRNITAKYYDWKLRRNGRKLSQLKAEKRRILEEVMDKETYKVAKDLLEKYGSAEEKPSMQVVRASALPAMPMQPYSAPVTPAKSVISSLVSSTPQVRHRQSGPILPMPMPHTPQRLMPIPGTPNQLTPLKGDQLPRPIMPAGKGGAFDRLVDFLIGDGPANRFALICSSCKSHNGMAIAEEFEFLSFRCAYCRHLNPSRKTKPKPPVLMTTPIHTDTSDHKSSSESDMEDSPMNSTTKTGSTLSLNGTPRPSAPPLPDEKNEQTSSGNPFEDTDHMSVDEEEIVDQSQGDGTPKSDAEKKED